MVGTASLKCPNSVTRYPYFLWLRISGRTGHWFQSNPTSHYEATAASEAVRHRSVPIDHRFRSFRPPASLGRRAALGNHATKSRRTSALAKNLAGSAASCEEGVGPWGVCGKEEVVQAQGERGSPLVLRTGSGGVSEPQTRGTSASNSSVSSAAQKTIQIDIN